MGDQRTVAWALGYLGWTYGFLGDFDAAKTSLERSVALARLQGEDAKHIVMQSLSLLGDIPYWQGNWSEARMVYEESIAFGKEIHSVNMLTYPLTPRSDIDFSA